LSAAGRNEPGELNILSVYGITILVDEKWPPGAVARQDAAQSRTGPRVFPSGRLHGDNLEREEHFERFLSVYEEEYESRYGSLRDIAKKAAHRFLECGILEYGFARVVCGKCRAEFLVAFNCKARMLCPCTSFALSAYI
jgi:uncharacterized protein YeaO (DUF488 family)